MSCALSGDGTRVATASDDTTARIWGAATGANLCTYFALATVCSVDSSPIDGTFLVVATGTEHPAASA